MKINKTIFRYRNDFEAEFICEHCLHTYEAWGYRDDNFYDVVLPSAICPNCGLSGQGETKEAQIERLDRKDTIIKYECYT